MKDKDAYIQKLHARLDKWNADIDKLRAKANRVADESRLEYQNQIENLRNKHQEAEQSLAKVQEDGGVREAWKDLKSGVQAACDAMAAAIRSAQSRFK